MNIFLFDLETTGVDVDNDRIVQIAWMVLDEDLLIVGEPMSFLVNPGIPIPKGASDVHGITDHMVSKSPMLVKIIPKLIKAMKGCYIGGFNSNSFDVPLLVNEFIRYGTPLPFDNNTRFIDVLAMYRNLNSMKLSAIYRRLFNEELEGAHDALSDVQATRRILRRITGESEEPGNTPDEWANYAGGMNDPYWFKKVGENLVFAKGKHENCIVSLQKSYCEWMMSKPFAINTKATLCDYFGADLWKSVAAKRFVYNEQSDDDDMPF